MTQPTLSGESHRKLIRTAVEESKRLVIMVFYLWVVFGLYVLDESLILGKEHISFQMHGFAIINALVLGKVLLIGEDMSFADRFKDWPLIYPILYKALAFMVLFLAFHFAESIGVGLWDGKSVVESLPHEGNGTWQAWLCVAAILFISLVPFFAFREIGRVIGERELWALMFKKRSGDLKLRSVR